jgi:hypothetical protein
MKRLELSDKATVIAIMLQERARDVWQRVEVNALKPCTAKDICAEKELHILTVMEATLKKFTLCLERTEVVCRRFLLVNRRHGANEAPQKRMERKERTVRRKQITKILKY